MRPTVLNDEDDFGMVSARIYEAILREMLYGGGLQGQLQDGFCNDVPAVTEDVSFMDEVSGDGLDAKRADALEVGEDGLLAFAGVAVEGVGKDGSGVDEGVVEDLGARVIEDFFDVLRGGETEALVGLGHEVADVDAGGVGPADGFGDPADEEVGDERGVERTGAEGDEFGGGDGVEGFGERGSVGGGKYELGDGAVRGGDVGFAVDDGVVSHARGDGGVGGGAGVDAASGGEDLRADLDGLGEVSRDSGEGGEKEIAEAVAFEIAMGKAVLEEPGEQGFVLRERDEAVADVAGGKHLEVFAEAAGGASVVRYGDDRGKLANESRKILEGRVGERGGAGGCGDKGFESAQKRGQSGSTANGDNAKLAGGVHGAGL